MARVVRIVGARPQFMQVPLLRKKLIEAGYEELLLHTGQHYDSNMSDIFIQQLKLPEPDFKFSIEGTTHAQQTANMLVDIENTLLSVKPLFVVVDGDTNSTLAGALAAAKLNIPVVHVESGLRSFDKTMPEEINRIMTDHISSILCAPTNKAMNNLKQEGLASRSVQTGDLMFDCFKHYSEFANQQILSTLDLQNDTFALATVHRASNTDNEQCLMGIFEALNQLKMPTILPLHPRTHNRLKKFFGDNFQSRFSNIQFIEPVGYLEMLALLNASHIILTDSGGLQREAYFAQKPSVVLRDDTEWTEQVDDGWTILASHHTEKIIAAFNAIQTAKRKQSLIYGDGFAADKIVAAIEQHCYLKEKCV